MKKNGHIEHQVEQTLHALDGMERATTDDFFYTRLQARMTERDQPHSVYDRLSPALVTAAAALCLLIAFNILTVLQYNEQYGNADALRQQNLEALAEDYYLEIPSIYELESNE